MKLLLTSNGYIRNKRTFSLFWYLLLFYLIWTVKELWVVPLLHLGDTAFALAEAILKVSFWFLPVWVLIKNHLNTSPASYLQINRNRKKGFLWGMAVSLLFILIVLMESYVFHTRTFTFSLSLDDWLNGILLAGITEEVVFRGFILQELRKRFSFWKSNLVTALLFVWIHYPIWIANGEFLSWGSHLYIFLFGLLLGFVYKKINSLWAVILIHSIHNLLSLL